MQTISPTAVSLDINGFDVDIKSKHEGGRWSVIAFTPSCSLRSSKTHRPNLLDMFCEAVLAGCDSDSDEDLDAVREAVLLITPDITSGR
jgi:hypothetical protein